MAGKRRVKMVVTDHESTNDNVSLYLTFIIVDHAVMLPFRKQTTIYQVCVVVVALL
jgi:hypothetical protein